MSPFATSGSITASVVMTAASGAYPPVKPFAAMTTSGSMPQCSKANRRPVRPNPVMTSSMMSRMS